MPSTSVHRSVPLSNPPILLADPPGHGPQHTGECHICRLIAFTDALLTMDPSVPPSLTFWRRKTAFSGLM
jgi:hypothetical protein